MTFSVMLRTGILSLIVLLVACGGSNSARPGSTDSPSDSLADATPAKPQSTYASVLSRCALAGVENNNSSCTLETLPLLGMDVENPTVDDIMNRVLASHNWMAERFENILLAYPAEMLTLFKGLTAVVIDDDIRPSFYSSNTGAIYIDPFYLFTSVSEKLTINPKQDYRSGYSDPLQFRAWNRYLKDGDYAFRYGSLTDDSTRTFNDVLFLSARLFLHELAHVNDFLPYDSYDSFDANMSVAQATNSVGSSRTSDRLEHLIPLQSSVLKGLGQVIFQGATATETQTAYSASFVGEEFENDFAADTYAYSSRFEDAAMLFEVTMMKYFFDIDHQTGFVTPEADAYYCSDYRIGWAATNWFANTDVKERAIFVTDALLPSVDLSLFYQDAEAPEVIYSGNWCLTAPSNSQQLSKPQGVFDEVLNPAEFEHYGH